MASDDPVETDVPLVAEWSRRMRDIQNETEAKLRELVTEARRQPVAAGHEGLSVLSGRGEIIDAIQAVARRCTTEQLSMHPRPPRPEALRETEPEDRDALARGIRMRGLVTTAVRSSPAAVAYYTELSEDGLQMRVADGLAALLIVVDRSVALVHIGFDDDGEPQALLTESELLVQMLCDLFEKTWASATPLGEERAAGDTTLTSRQHEVLRLCATGLKDDAIARHLGVSTRTLSTELSGAMAALGARSRFQAGVLWSERAAGRALDATHPAAQNPST